MMTFKAVAITVASLSVLFLGACSSGSNQASSPSPAATTAAEPKPSESAAPTSGDKMSSDKMSSNEMHGGHGGQVVEVGDYHLELLLGKESGETHMDVFLQKGETHEAVPNAKVTAQVQAPDGAQKTLAFEYDPAEKHYTAKLPSTAPGTYKVAILSDIKGEKVNGRFSFKQ
ncbi:hypothetical protein C7B82_12825 [Stenomitos frigidus ULC18]|uniref:YtkA-like domain-containing protein n=1 Tax=Stenomitos frigidus ULC18 TaxID=2107698 RepID=A0A2T1E7N6_9CYAN|nr:hypothetical protein C7B82_12825 [Stenomitos frigidus ULC18]